MLNTSANCYPLSRKILKIMEKIQNSIMKEVFKCANKQNLSKIFEIFTKMIQF